MVIFNQPFLSTTGLLTYLYKLHPLCYDGTNPNYLTNVLKHPFSSRTKPKVLQPISSLIFALLNQPLTIEMVPSAWLLLVSNGWQPWHPPPGPTATPIAPISTPPATVHGPFQASCLPGGQEAAHAMWLLLSPWPGGFDSPPSIPSSFQQSPRHLSPCEASASVSNEWANTFKSY